MAHDGTGGWRRPLPAIDRAGGSRSCARELRARRRALAAARARDVRRVNSHASLRRAHLLAPRSTHRRLSVAHGSEADPSASCDLARTRGCDAVPAGDHRLSRAPHGVPCATRATRRCDRIATASLEPERGASPRIAVAASRPRVLSRWSPFDPRGSRLGSGAGFYDRACSTCAPDGSWRRPTLIGVGYEFQRVAALAPAPGTCRWTRCSPRRLCYRRTMRQRRRHELLADEIGTLDVRHRRPRRARKKRTTGWDGVRNFQARNFLREMQRGDLAFFYHSSCDVPGVAGIVRWRARRIRTARRSIRRTITTMRTAIRTSRAGTWST